MAHFSMLEMAAKPKHPINICDDSAEEADTAETNLIQKVFIMLFSVKKSLYSKQGLLITFYVNGLKKIYAARF